MVLGPRQPTLGTGYQYTATAVSANQAHYLCIDLGTMVSILRERCSDQKNEDSVNCGIQILKC